MALNPEDARPTDLSDEEKYAKIWAWYQANIKKIESRSDSYAKQSAEYIRNMPSPGMASSEQIRDTFKHVRTGLLEWAYHESDGAYKMAAYAGA